MNYKTLKFSVDNGIGILTISRPEALNALNVEVINELSEFVNHLDTHEVRSLIITGEGKAFVAGADITAFKSMAASEAKELAHKGQALFTKLEELEIPVIAAVNGFALGGGLELALACDFIIASEKAKMGLPEVGLGLIPGYGGTQRLARNVGKGIAKAITLSGDMFAADQMMAWGLVVEIAESESLMDAAKSWAEKISAKGPQALTFAKQAIQQGFDKEITDGFRLEAELFAKCFETQDQKEGVSAFLEKRSPKFQGK